MRGQRRFLVLAHLLCVLAVPAVGRAQQPADEGQDKRILGIIPNYRTAPTLKDYQPIDVSQKFTIARDDALDRGTFVLAALFAADAQLMASNPSFGHGIEGYGRYYAASLGDLMIGDVMTEGIYPALFRQDPRYFRLATGGGWARMRYAMGQIILTHGDAGRTQVNVSEIIGNATAVAISNSYYKDNRSVSSDLWKLGLQLGTDMVANIVKEFGPELAQRLSGKRKQS